MYCTNVYRYGKFLRRNVDLKDKLNIVAYNTLYLKILFLFAQEERFKIYATYCKNFDNSDSVLKQKIKRNKDFERFLKVQLF